MTSSSVRSAEALTEALTRLDQTTDSLPGVSDGRRVALVALYEEAQAAGDPALARQLLWEVQLAYATVAIAAVTDQTGPRFVDFAPDLLTDDALDYFVQRLRSPSISVKSVLGDFIWEYGGHRRRYAIDAPTHLLAMAGNRAEAARGGAEFGWLHANDAIIRAGQISAASNNDASMRAVADRALGLLAELKDVNPRHALDMVVALVTVARVVTEAEVASIDRAAAEIAADLQESEGGVTSHLGRAAMHLRKRFLAATGAPPAAILEVDRLTVDSLIREGDDQVAAANGLGAGMAYAEALDRLSRMPGEARRAADVRRKVRAANVAAVSEMKEITVTGDIPKGVVEAFIQSFLRLPFPEVLEHLALRIDVLIGADTAREAHRQAQEVAPFASMVTHVEVTRGGRRIAPMRPEDRERQKLYRAVRLHLGFQNVWLAEIFRRLRDERHVEAASIVAFLRDSANFEEANLALIELGIERAWADDVVSAMHILLPQLEDVLRNLLNRSGVDPLAGSSSIPGVGMESALWPVCSRLEAAGILDEDTAFLFNLTIADPLGANLRNDVGHGLIRIEDCTWPKLARIVQLYLIVAILQPAATD